MKNKVLKTAAGLLAALIFLCSALSVPASAAFGGARTRGSEKLTVIAVLDDGLSANETAAAISALTDGGIKVKYLYHRLINGFSAEIDAADYGLLQSFPGVMSLSAEASYDSPAVTLGEASESDAVTISLRADPDYGGEGTVVAVLDSGFDATHPAFRLTQPSKAELTKAEVISAQYSLNAHTPAYVSVKLPFVYDYAGQDTDVSSDDVHGTGIAGIIAGNCDGFEGAAPEAQLLLMKVFGDDGSAVESDIIAALEDAVRLGADVVNLSLGSPVGSADGEPLDTALGSAITAAVVEGVTVNGAAGNDGHIGGKSENDNIFGKALPSPATMDYGTVNAPASVEAVTAVAGKNSDAEYKYCVEFGDLKVPFTDTSANYTVFGQKSFTELLGGKTYKYVAVPGIGSAEDFVSVKDKLRGNIALIKRGELTFVEKINNAYDCGAIGAIIWDNIENNTAVVNMDLSGALLPAIFISCEYGSALSGAGEGEVTVTDKLLGRFATADSDRISDTSSWGVTPSFTLKPELTSTGVNVYTAMPGGGAYALMSGTSAASAAASGAAAVLIGQRLQDAADSSPEVIKRLLMNSAELLTDPDTGIYYSPRRQGAGAVNVTAAAALETSFVAAATGLPKIEIPSLRSTEAALELTLENESDEAKTYVISCAVQGDAYTTLDDGTNTAEADLCQPRTFDGASAILNGKEINIYSPDYAGASVTLNAGESVKLTVKIMLDKETASEYGEVFGYGFYLEGFVTAEPADGSGSASVPYVCFTGDWDSLPVLDATVYDSGRLSYYLSSCFHAESETYSFDMILGLNQYSDSYEFDASCVSFSPDGDGELDAFYLSMALLRSARDVTGVVVSADGEVVADMGRMDYISKTTVQSDALTALDFEVWDGTSAENPFYIFPDGDYTLIICAYPAFDGSTPQKYEFPFTIDTQKPEIESIKLVVNTDGSETLVVGVSDGNALQGGLLYLDESGFYAGSYIGDHTEGLKTSDTYQFDVTGWRDRDKKYVYVDVYDYAMNRLTVKIPLDDLAEGNR